jgi:hypothetical protein
MKQWNLFINLYNFKLLSPASLIFSILWVYKPAVVFSILDLVILSNYFNLTVKVFIFNIFWNFILAFYSMSIHWDSFYFILYLIFVFILIFFKIQFFNGFFNLPIINWCSSIHVIRSFILLCFRFTLNLWMYFIRYIWT